VALDNADSEAAIEPAKPSGSRRSRSNRTPVATRDR
jgi:hypothetical protein